MHPAESCLSPCHEWCTGSLLQYRLHDREDFPTVSKLSLSVLLGAVLVLLPAAQPGRAQTLPSGADLIAQMQDAVRSAGSAHLTFGGTLVDTALTSGSVGGEGDVSARDQRSHLIADIPVIVSDGAIKTTLIAREETIRVGHREADRTAFPSPQSGAAGGQETAGQQWQCTTVKRIPPEMYDLVGVPADLTDVVDVGPDTIGDVPVWHITGSSVDKTTNESQKHDYYISQRGSLLIRQTFTIALNPGPTQTTETLAVDYSRYGESVHVTLPATCRHHAADDTSPVGVSEIFPSLGL